MSGWDYMTTASHDEEDVIHLHNACIKDLSGHKDSGGGPFPHLNLALAEYIPHQKTITGVCFDGLKKTERRVLNQINKATQTVIQPRTHLREEEFCDGLFIARPPVKGKPPVEVIGLRVGLVE